MLLHASQKTDGWTERVDPVSFMAILIMQFEALLKYGPLPCVVVKSEKATSRYALGTVKS